MNKARNSLFALALTTAAISAAPASGATTIGSDLASSPDTVSGCVGTCTRMLSFLGTTLDQPAGVTAPADGVVTSWSVRVGTSAAPMRLRAATMGGGTLYTGGNASGTVAPAANAVSTFSSRVPIKSGEQIGLELDGAAWVLNGVPAGTIAGHWLASQGLNPGVGTAGIYAGNTPATFGGTAGSELLVNATIEPDADQDGFGDESQDPCPGVRGVYDGCVNAAPVALKIKLGKVKLNKKNGSAKITVTVPGPGGLQALGKTVKPGLTGVKKAGNVTFVIKPAAKTRKKLRSKHKAKVKFTIEFVPQSGPGFATAKKSITLKKR